MSDYVSRVKKLNLPDGQFMVCGSAILDVLGIRKAQDVDILVSPELFEKLEKENGWQRHHKYTTTLEHPEGVSGAKQTLDFMRENYSLKEALPKATIIEGIPFMNLDMLINAKTQLGREKDIEDIKLIKKYLENKKQNS
jgi:predicted nucleotidyltransferase